jgi:hypothetical protein
MARDRRTTTVLALVALLLGGVTGCSDDAVDAEEATPQSLAAAALAHYDAPLVAAAPIFGDERLRRGDLAVELAFDRSEGDNTHVRVVVSDRLPYGRDDEDPCAGPWKCQDVGTDEVAGTLLYEAGYPEEDPGVVLAWSERGDEVVWAYAYGPFIAPDDEGGPDEEATALGDALAAIVTDPAVGRRTSAGYDEGGQELCGSGDWLEWYGQGNGSPRPEDFRDWCAED